MTENDWQSSEDSRLMRDFLRHGVFALLDTQPDDCREGMRQHLLRLGDRRKVGLFACACCRRLWPLIQDERLGDAVEVTERYLDEIADEAERFAAARIAESARQRITPRPGATGSIVALEDARRAAAWAVWDTVRLETEASLGNCVVAAVRGELVPSPAAALADQATLLRDIIGNPFRPVSLDPEWRTSTAVTIAKGMYESRDFSAMPILADALQDAGCDNDDILNHCRDEKQPHVKGCWVVDLVMGKQ